MPENGSLSIYPFGEPEILPCRHCGGEPEDVFCEDHYSTRGGPWIYIRCKRCGFEVNNDSFKDLVAIRTSEIKVMAELVLTEWNGRKTVYPYPG